MATSSSIFYRIIRAGIGVSCLLRLTKVMFVSNISDTTLPPLPFLQPPKETQKSRHYTTLCDTILHDFVWKYATAHGRLIFLIKLVRIAGLSSLFLAQCFQHILPENAKNIAIAEKIEENPEILTNLMRKRSTRNSCHFGASYFGSALLWSSKMITHEVLLFARYLP